MKDSNRPVCVILTGLSGAGKSTAIKALEDLDFYCMDNVPFELIGSATNYFLQNTNNYRNFAIGFDIRSQLSKENLLTLKINLEKVFDLDIVFFEASLEALLIRYNTTRRKHPLLMEAGELSAAIKREVHELNSIRDEATWVLDTSSISVHDLSRKVEDRYSKKSLTRELYITISSFGFKYGGLNPAELVFDVRFLRNPYFNEKLRSQTGLNRVVQDYIFEDERSSILFDKIEDLIEFTIPEYYKEGKNYLRIGIGCTGGKHRSVTFAERLAISIAEKNIENISVSVLHRDIEK